MQRKITYTHLVFIGYADESMRKESARLYPADRDSYFTCMDEMIQHYQYWECQIKETCTPIESYQRWQLEKHGNFLLLQMPSGEEFENRQMSIDEMGRLIDLHFELQMDDYWNY